MRLIVDASVIVKWFVHEDGHEAALYMLERGDICIAPDLAIVEVAGALDKKVKANTLRRDQALEAIRAVRQKLVLLPSGDVVEQAMQLAFDLGHPLADCVYLACAIKLGCSLVTSDEAFRRKAAVSMHASTIVALRVESLDFVDASQALSSVGEVGARVGSLLSKAHRDAIEQKVRELEPEHISLSLGGARGRTMAALSSWIRAEQQASTMFAARRLHEVFMAFSPMERVDFLAFFLLGESSKSIAGWSKAKSDATDLVDDIVRFGPQSDGLLLLMMHWPDFERGAEIVRQAALSSNS